MVLLVLAVALAARLALRGRGKSRERQVGDDRPLQANPKQGLASKVPLLLVQAALGRRVGVVKC